MHCPCCGTSRREVLAMLTATAVLGRSAFAQGGGPRIIDTHHHIYPPKYVAPNLDRLLKDSAALPASAYTSWTPQHALEQMDKAGIATAVVSMTTPECGSTTAMILPAPAPASVTSSARR